MSDFTKDEILLRACRVLVTNFSNQVEEGREVVHTRVFNFFLHPERRYVYFGVSPCVSPETSNRYEHAVPCAVLVRECFRLLEEDNLDIDEIAQLLKKHWKIVRVTKEESQRMDFELGYRSKMPEGWTFEEGDTFERFKLANIEIIPEESEV